MKTSVECDDNCQISEHKGYRSCMHTGQCELLNDMREILQSIVNQIDPVTNNNVGLGTYLKAIDILKHDKEINES